MEITNIAILNEASVLNRNCDKFGFISGQTFSGKRAGEVKDKAQWLAQRLDWKEGARVRRMQDEEIKRIMQNWDPILSPIALRRVRSGSWYPKGYQQRNLIYIP